MSGGQEGTLRTTCIGCVDFPDKVLQAHRKKQLVIFAGAGVSCASPSDLPLFGRLVQEIASGLEVWPTGEPAEVFLGRLKGKGADVHRLVLENLSRPDSRHNETHSSLAGLFQSPKDLRIVTTNFDLHLESAIKERWSEGKAEVYSAPALPVGSRFSGLVHLHGQLGLDSQRMILTDSDYGRAYLTEGWARRFITELFGHYLVLFVGYSYSDAPLKYLARGLPSDFGPGRFALAHEHFEEWQYLGIEPIRFSSAGDYWQLKYCLTSWGALISRGAVDVELRMRDLLAAGPGALSREAGEEVLYYREQLETEHLFYRYAGHPAWLDWLPRRLLDPLFEPGETSERLRSLADWFAKDALGPRGDITFRIASSEHQRLSPRLAWAIAHEVGTTLSASPSPQSAARATAWLELLLERSDHGNSDWLLGLGLHNLSVDHQADLAARLFLLLAEPRIERSTSALEVENQATSLRIAFRHGVAGDINGAWQRLFKLNLDRFAPILLPGLVSIFSATNLKLRAAGSTHEDYDPLSGQRASIAVHIQNELLGTSEINSLIDAARDVIDWHIEKNPGVAEAWTNTWLASEVPLLRRFAIYSLERLASMSAEAKVRRLITLQWLASPSVKTELFLFLKTIYPKIGLPLRRRLLATAERIFIGRRVAKDVEVLDYQEFSFYSLLAWLQDAAPSCQLIQKRIEKTKLRNPDFEPAEHSEFNFYSYGIQSIRYVSPLSRDQLRVLTPSEWLAAFEKVVAVRHGRMGLDEDHGIGLLIETGVVVGESLEFGMRLAEELFDRHDFEHSAWAGCLFRTWGDKAFLDIEWRRLILLLGRQPLLTLLADKIVMFLGQWARRKENQPTKVQWLLALSLTQKLWVTCDEALPENTEDLVLREDDGSQRDWLDVATRCRSGRLAEIAILLILGLRKESAGLPRPVKSLLTKMCSEQSVPRELAACVLAAQFRALRSIDEVWVRENLEPRFDWKHPRHATQAWHGLLNGSPDSSLVPLFEKAFPHLIELGKRRGEFVSQLAQLAFHSHSDPYKEGWLRTFLQSSNSSDRAKLSEVLDLMLRRSTLEARIELWRRWLSSYFRHRFVDSPALETSELSFLSGWARTLGPFLDEILNEFERRESPPARPGSGILAYQFAPWDEADPTSVVRLCTWVLRGTDFGHFWERGEVRRLIEVYMDQGAASDQLERLIELYVIKGGEEGPELRERLRARNVLPG